MKKIFIIGCGCLGIIVILFVVLLFVVIESDSESSPKENKESSQNENSRDGFFGVEPDHWQLLKWEKQGPQEFLQEDAIDNVKSFFRQNKIKVGFAPSTKTICFFESADFSEWEYRHINLYKKQIELKVFMHWLSDFSALLNEKDQIIKKGNTKTIYSSSSIKWGDFDFNCRKKGTIIDGTAIADYYEEQCILSNNGNNLITYTLDSKGERFNTAKMAIRGISAYDGLITSFLKHNPGAVKLEYSAWSWDAAKKRGKFALALILEMDSEKLKSLKKGK